MAILTTTSATDLKNYCLTALTRSCVGLVGDLISWVTMLVPIPSLPWAGQRCTRGILDRAVFHIWATRILCVMPSSLSFDHVHAWLIVFLFSAFMDGAKPM